MASSVLLFNLLRSWPLSDGLVNDQTFSKEINLKVNLLDSHMKCAQTIPQNNILVKYLLK